MMIAIAVIALVIAVATGGDVRRLGTVALRRSWLLGAALAIQIVITTTGGSRDGFAAAHLLSYALVGAWFVVNRSIPGLGVIAAGGGLNAAAIVANRGVMPATRSALARAGIHTAAGRFANSAAVAHPHLFVLGDRFAVPRGVPLANVFSVGDVVIAAGVTWAVLRLTRRPASAAGRNGSVAAATPVVVPTPLVVPTRFVAPTPAVATLRPGAAVPRSHPLPLPPPVPSRAGRHRLRNR
jgi:hypothetical protein